MFKPTVLKTESRPEPIIKLGNGYYYYNYNITETTGYSVNVDTNDDPIEVPMYEFTQVKLFGTPSYEKCVQEIIREHVSANEEFDIINSYNKYVLDGVDEQAKQNYLDYLALLDAIKSKIKEDFK